MVHTGIKNLKHKPFGGAWSIHDQDVIQFRNEAIQEFITNEKNLDHDNIKNEYFTL